mgnify:CR=1 FL=1
MVLQRTGALALYYDHDRQTPIPLDVNLIYTEPLPFVNNTVTVFVEWQSVQHGTSILNLLEASTLASQDSLRFHSFRSLIVAFGGFTQDPADTDDDGSIGDPINEEGVQNREGIFDIAQSFYDTGWDVLAFDEADYTLLVESVAEKEIKNAIDNRFVDPMFMGGVSIMGYSQGGGVVQNMIERELDPVNSDPDHLPVFGVYLDAVVHDTLGVPEVDWPESVAYLLNIYQTNNFPRGGDIDNTEVDPGFILDEINVTTCFDFNNNLNHFDIDDDFDVQLYIFVKQEQLLDR